MQIVTFVSGILIVCMLVLILVIRGMIKDIEYNEYRIDCLALELLRITNELDNLVQNDDEPPEED